MPADWGMEPVFWCQQHHSLTELKQHYQTALSINHDDMQNIHIAIEKWPCIVDLPINNGDFPSFFCIFTRGYFYDALPTRWLKRFWLPLFPPFDFFDAQRGTLPRGKSVKGIGQRSDGLHHVMPGPRSSHRQAVVGGVVEMAWNK